MERNSYKRPNNHELENGSQEVRATLFLVSLAVAPILGLVFTISLALRSDSDQSVYGEAEASTFFSLAERENLVDAEMSTGKAVNDSKYTLTEVTEEIIEPFVVSFSSHDNSSNAYVGQDMIVSRNPNQIEVMMYVPARLKQPSTEDSSGFSLPNETGAIEYLNTGFRQVNPVSLQSSTVSDFLPEGGYALDQKGFFEIGTVLVASSSKKPRRRPISFEYRSNLRSVDTQTVTKHSLSTEPNAWAQVDANTSSFRPRARPKRHDLFNNTESNRGVQSSKAKVFAVVAPIFYEVGLDRCERRGVFTLVQEARIWKLVGVFSNRNETWGLIRDCDGKVFRVSKGGDIKGRLVVDINKHGLLLGYYDDEIKVKVGESFQ